MRRYWRFTHPIIQEGGVLNLRYIYGVYQYKLLITFDGIDVSAKIRARTRIPIWMSSDVIKTRVYSLDWEDIASIKDYSLQDALMWAEDVLDKELENPVE